MKEDLGLEGRGDHDHDRPPLVPCWTFLASGVERGLLSTSYPRLMYSCTTRPCPCPSSIYRLSYAVVKNDHRRLLLVLSCAIFWYFHFCLVCLTFSTAFSPSSPCALAFRGRVPYRPYPIE